MESHLHCYCCDDTSDPIHIDEVASWPKRLLALGERCGGGGGRCGWDLLDTAALGERGREVAAGRNYRYPRANTQHKAISHRPMETHNISRVQGNLFTGDNST